MRNRGRPKGRRVVRNDVEMGRLTTHVLDTASGKPAAGLTVELFRLGDAPQRLITATTNGDGRLDRPLIEGDAFGPGLYELRFHAGDYLRRSGTRLPDPPFFDVVPIGLLIGSA